MKRLNASSFLLTMTTGATCTHHVLPRAPLPLLDLFLKNKVWYKYDILRQLIFVLICMQIAPKIYCLVTDVSFRKRELKHCDPLKDKYGNFPTLKSAQSACLSDINCNAVYDEHCDNEGEFYLCPTTTSLQSSQHSCVYDKGKNIISQLTNLH